MAPTTKPRTAHHVLSLIHEQLLSKLDHTYRFNGIPLTLPRESVSQHSFWVVFFTNLIVREIFDLQATAGTLQRQHYLEIQAFALRQALMHDVEEVYVGDVLFDIKYHPAQTGNNAIKDELHRIVRHEVEHRPDDAFKREMTDILGSRCMLIPEEKAIVHTIVKLADWISAYKVGYEEYAAGNVLGKFDEVMQKTKVGMVKCLTDIHKNLNLLGLPYNETFFTLLNREVEAI